MRDVSKLPTYGHGTKNPIWWGTQSFMVIEGLGFAFAIATYLYLYNQNDVWPLTGAPPSLMWGSILLAVYLVSEIPNIWVKKAAAQHDLRKSRIGLIVMTAIGFLTIVLRVFEFTTLNVKYGDNAYGSIVWFLLGLHTTHILTDWVESLVMTVMIHIGPVDLRRFPEIEDNQDYWHFVVGFWVVIYLILYWVPRWFMVHG